jgi:hypothetical protein
MRAVKNTQDRLIPRLLHPGRAPGFAPQRSGSKPMTLIGCGSRDSPRASSQKNAGILTADFLRSLRLRSARHPLRPGRTQAPQAPGKANRGQAPQWDLRDKPAGVNDLTTFSAPGFAPAHVGLSGVHVVKIPLYVRDEIRVFSRGNGCINGEFHQQYLCEQ